MVLCVQGFEDAIICKNLVGKTCRIELCDVCV